MLTTLAERHMASMWLSSFGTLSFWSMRWMLSVAVPVNGGTPVVEREVTVLVMDKHKYEIRVAEV